ncbi:MAG: isopeptide-forming domain-containing fimbrial protein, partial [Firmicutes bacterium]|nr:isopeptide-forming domain-containing fimbrial protein [Bacillota bacterium]
YKYTDVWRGPANNPGDPKVHHETPPNIIGTAATGQTVKDVLPPVPAVVTSPNNGKLWVGVTSSVTGTWSPAAAQAAAQTNNPDPAVKLYAVVNTADNVIKDGGNTVLGTLNSDGTWSYTLPASAVSSLQAGDKVYFILEDANGNKNPIADTPIHDTTAKAAPFLTVALSDLILSSSDKYINLPTARTIADSTTQSQDLLTLIGAKAEKRTPSVTLSTNIEFAGVNPAWDTSAYYQLPGFNTANPNGKPYKVSFDAVDDKSIASSSKVTVMPFEGPVTPYIGANNFSITVDQATAMMAKAVADRNAQLIDLSGAKGRVNVTDPLDKNLVEVTSVAIPNPATPGDYNVTFHVKGTPMDADHMVTVTAHVYGGKIEGTLFVDSNGNGKLDSNEGMGATPPGVFKNKAVNLYQGDYTSNVPLNSPYMTVNTDANGHFVFDVKGSTYVSSGTYTILFPDLSNYGMTTTDGTRTVKVTIDLASSNEADYHKTVDGGYAWPHTNSVNELSGSFSKQVYDPAKDSNADPYDTPSAYAGTPPTPNKTANAAAGYVDTRVVNDSTTQVTYRLSFKVPADTTGYGTLTVKDIMDPGLSYISPAGPGSIVVKVTDSTGTRTLPIDQNQLRLAGEATTTGQTFSYTITDIKNMAGAVVDVYVSAQIVRLASNNEYKAQLLNRGQLVLNEPLSGMSPSQYIPGVDPAPTDQANTTLPPTSPDTKVDNVGVIKGITFKTDATHKNTVYNSATDTLFSGVTVTLLDQGGNPISGKSVTTGADGKYEFNGLAAGTYGLQFSLPGGYVYTTLAATSGKASGITIALGDATVQQKTQNSGYYLGGNPIIAFQEAPLVVPATPGASHIMTQAELKAKMTVTSQVEPGVSLLAQTVATPAIPVDTQNVGVTKVTYTVSDGYGNNATATRAVVVDDGRYVIKDTDGDGKNDVILGAKNYVISSNAADWSMVKAKALSYAEAYTADGTPISANDITWTQAPAGYQAGAPEGNYPITWQVPSPAGGTVTKDIKAIVKNADVIDQGTKDSQYAIAANNFKANQTDAAAIVAGSPQTFINKAQAVVIKLVDSAPDKSVFLSSYGQFSASLGVYGPNYVSGPGSSDPIRFLISGVAATVQKADVTGVVSNGPAPVLSATTPLEVWVGPAADKPAGAIDPGAYTIKYGVSVSDFDINNQPDPTVTIDSVTAAYTGTPMPATINASAVGLYPVKFSVTDRDGNTVTAQRVVAVNDGTYVVGKGRILAAKSFVAKLSDVTSLSSQINQEILSRSRTALYDGETGAPIQETSVQDTGGYTKQEGVYPGIKVAGVDNPASNPLITKTITGKVVDRDVLVITPDPQVESKPTYYAYGNNLQLTPVQAQAIIDAANPTQALLDALKAGANMSSPDGTLKDLTVKIASDANGFLTK